MIFTIDVRNSSISIALMDVNTTEGKLVASWEFSCSRFETSDECIFVFAQIENLFSISHSDITGVAICSVNSSITATICDAVFKYYSIRSFVVKPGIKSMLKIKIDNPAELGADLLVNLVAAARRGVVPAIVIDMGIATTISVVNKNHEIVGSVICPGIGASSKALAEAAPQLLFDSISEDFFPKHIQVVGKNTNDSVHSGLIRTAAYSLNGFVREICQSMFANDEVAIYIKNAFSDAIFDYLDFKYTASPHLTFEGLLQLYKINIFN